MEEEEEREEEEIDWGRRSRAWSRARGGDSRTEVAGGGGRLASFT